MIADLLRTTTSSLLLAGGLVGPGWLLGRALGAPAGPAGALLGSAALMMNLVLGLDALGIRLDAASLSLGLGAIMAGLAGISLGRRVPQPRADLPTARAAPFHWATHSGLWLAAALGLGAITLRAVIEPLSGFDTRFRWDFVAREMLREGNLQFYPAITAADFERYGWCDGIAPLVSTLYAWCHVCLGQLGDSATTPLVLAQAATLFWLVWQLARHRDGPVAGAAAVALLCTSAGLLWGIAMGQETGLTAVSLAAMFWFIEKHRGEPAKPWLVWAGLAAGTGALAREYGLAYLALGAFALGWWRAGWRSLTVFVATAALVAGPWYLRNGLKTGNPLYPFDFAGLLPTNPVYREFNQIVAASHSVFAAPGIILPQLATLAAVLAGVPLALGLVRGGTRWREHAPWLVALVASLALWLWSVALTAGGFVYSTRVLTPAIALGAVLGGAWLARATEKRSGWVLAVLLIVVTDAGARSLHLPMDAFPRWWQGRFFSWRDFGDTARAWRGQPNWQAIAAAAEQRKILVSDAGLVPMMIAVHGHPVSYLSPAVRFLFEPQGNFETACARLRTAGFRFVILTRYNPIVDEQFNRSAFFRTLQATAPAGRIPPCFIYDLYALKPVTAPHAS